MAENLRFIETLDHSDFDKGIAQSSAAVRKMTEDAVLASKGLNGMFDTAEMKQAAAFFDGVEKSVSRFQKAMSRDLPMKQELRETQKAAMELEQIWRGLSDGKKQTAAGRELRATIDTLIGRAGALKDTMGDVNAAMTFQASDTAKLDAVVGGINALAASAQVAAGAMQLLGVSQEDAAKVQADLMAVLSVVNGLQAIQNALQKESALMMGLNAAKTAAVTAATTLKAAVTKADTVATKAAAVAQWAWNAALAANPIGAVIAVVTALAAAIAIYQSRTAEADPSTKAFTESSKSLAEALAAGARKSAEASLELDAYNRKIQAFNGTAEQEKKLIQEINDKYGKQIGYLKDIGDAKAHLADLSHYYIKMMEEEAKAQSLAAAYGDTYAKMIKGEIGFDQAQAQLARLKSAWEDAAEGAKFYAAQIRIANNLAGRSTSSSSSGTQTTRTTTRTTRTSSGSTGGSQTTQSSPAGSYAWYNEQIKELENLADLQTDVAKRQEYLEQAMEMGYEQRLKFLGRVTAENLEALEPQSIADKLNAKLAETGKLIKPITIKLALPTAQEIAEQRSAEILKNTEGLRSAASAAAGAFRQLGSAVGGAAGKAINVAALMAQAIATMIQGYATATAQSASLGPWAWAAFGLAGLGQLMAMIAAVKQAAAFATGGIVGGNSFTGDRNLIRVNSGEMILNRSQQANLWNAINGGVGGGQVTFRIDGQQLVGVLQNYNGKYSKVR